MQAYKETTKSHTNNIMNYEYKNDFNKWRINMGLGYLKIEARTGDGVLPVSGANIVIKDSSGKILNQLKTNESGNTEKVTLFAPDKANTLRPSGENIEFKRIHTLNKSLPFHFICVIFKCNFSLSSDSILI